MIADFICTQSFSIATCGVLPCEDPRLLHLGCEYQTFLYIPVPPCYGLRRLKKARLILYKVPAACRARDARRDWYQAYPLCDFYSPCGPAYASPCVDACLRTCFPDDPRRCVLDIDATEVVVAWLEGVRENKGLMLCGAQSGAYVTCASHLSENAGMHPFLRVDCDEIKICQPLSVMPCSVSLDF